MSDDLIRNPKVNISTTNQTEAAANEPAASNIENAASFVSNDTVEAYQSVPYQEPPSHGEPLQLIAASLEHDLSRLTETHEKIFNCFNDLKTMYEQVNDATSRLVESIEADDAKKIQDLVSELKTMQQSFSMQYLMLQTNMQRENRQYTIISNIMSTKHETAKNSILNVR